MQVIPWITTKIKHRKIAILTISLTGKGKEQIDLFLLEQRKRQLEIYETWEDFTASNKLANKAVANGIPVYLHISGYGVMVRDFPGCIELNMIQGLIPNFQSKDYFVQINQLEGDQSLVSLVRKDTIKKLIEDKQINNFCISGLLIGPSPLVSLSTYLDKKAELIDLGGLSLKLTNGKVTGIKKSDPAADYSVLFINKRRSTSEAYAFACGILATINPSAYTLKNLLFINGFKEAVAAQVGKQLLKIGLGVLFIILLGNYALFDHLHSKKGELENIISSGKNMSASLTKLKSELHRKKKFITDNNLNDYYSMSYFSDQIGQLTGEAIRMEELNFNPLNKKIRTGQPVTFRKGIIIIKGTTTNIGNYQAFISSIQNKKWSEAILFQNYNYKPGQKDAFFHLEVKCDYSMIE